MISTRGQYAIRAILDIAEHDNGQPIPLHDISLRQKISLKYLEIIMRSLNKGGMITGFSGKGGGYRLSKSLDQYRIGDILRLTEGDQMSIACIKECESPCPRISECRTRSMWEKLDSMIEDYLDGITIADLIENTKCPESSTKDEN